MQEHRQDGQPEDGDPDTARRIEEARALQDRLRTVGQVASESMQVRDPGRPIEPASRDAGGRDRKGDDRERADHAP